MAELPADPKEAAREKVRIWLRALSAFTPPISFNRLGYSITVHSWGWEGRNDVFVCVVTIVKQQGNRTIFDHEYIRIVNPPLIDEGAENANQAFRQVLYSLCLLKEKQA